MYDRVRIPFTVDKTSVEYADYSDEHFGDHSCPIIECEGRPPAKTWGGLMVHLSKHARVLKDPNFKKAAPKPKLVVKAAAPTLAPVHFCPNCGFDISTLSAAITILNSKGKS
jgi:hypothetical protein